MPPPRFRLRTLMIAVAVAGMLLGCYVVGTRWQHKRTMALAQAAKHRRFERVYAATAAHYSLAAVKSRGVWARKFQIRAHALRHDAAIETAARQAY